MKKSFELQAISSPFGISTGTVKIIGKEPKSKPYISFEIVSTFGNKDTSPMNRTSGCIKDKDLEKFAVNILKAIKSKKLKK